MEIPNSSNSSPDISADFARYFAERQAYLDAPEPLYTPERLEQQEVDYLEKLLYTPLPIEIMKSLVSTVVDKLEECAKTNDQFTEELLLAIEVLLSHYAEKSLSSDFITFDDLIDVAERSMEPVYGADGLAPWNHPVCLEQTNAIGFVRTVFGESFYNQPNLQYICDEIDEWTVHDEVHPQQKERARYDEGWLFYGQAHGFHGRWTPQDRDGLTVWRLGLPAA